MDKNYWELYYKTKNVTEEPSLFSKFVIEKSYTKPHKTLIELGCGNGRDSVFFAKNNTKVLAVDQCESKILELKNKYQSNNFIDFKIQDFTALGTDYFFDSVYSRFTMHSITENQEDRVINWAYNQLNNTGYFLIEVRGQKNEYYKLGEPVKDQPHAYIYEGHYRRFLNKEILLDKLKKVGFTIVFSAEKNGFAPFEGSDQKFIRVVAKK